MTTLFQTISEIIGKSQSQISACFALTEPMIEEIFQAGIYHGLFEKENHGFHDRKNSVYCLIGTFFDLKKNEVQ